MTLLSACVVAVALVWAARHVAHAISRTRQERPALSALLETFAPGVAAAASDVRALLVWQPLASTARRLFPTEFAALDQASGGTFPFSQSQIERAHARWTADWLAWERAHDTEYKLKTAILEEELGEQMMTPFARARLDALEREKLDRYQRRYEEYARVGKALQALLRV